MWDIFKKEILLISVIPEKFGDTKQHSQHLQNKHVGAIFQQETVFLHRLEKLNWLPPYNGTKKVIHRMKLFTIMVIKWEL